MCWFLLSKAYKYSLNSIRLSLERIVIYIILFLYILAMYEL